MIEGIVKYFPELSDLQKEQFSSLKGLYEVWNSRINVISRKDMDNFYLHHVLHSLALAKFVTFVDGTNILDAGTGGGFPGIPLAILFPQSRFFLLDSIEKKIRVVGEVKNALGLTNVIPLRLRVEDNKEKYDFVVSRAVTSFPAFVKVTMKNIREEGRNKIKNGILYLKGGDLTAELDSFSQRVTVADIKNFFSEPFFDTKRIVYLPV